LLIFGLLGAAWMVGMTALLGVRRDWSQLPPAAMLQTLVALSGGALVASAAGLSRGRAMLGASSATLTGLLVGVPAVLLVVVATIDPRGYDQAVPTSDALMLMGALKCEVLVAAVAVPLLGCAWAITRGLTLSRPALSGACVGLAAATWAHAVVRVHCAVPGREHALLGHLLPLLPLIGLAAYSFASARPRRRITKR